MNGIVTKHFMCIIIKEKILNDKTIFKEILVYKYNNIHSIKITIFLQYTIILFVEVFLNKRSKYFNENKTITRSSPFLTKIWRKRVLIPPSTALLRTLLSVKWSLTRD